MPSNPRTLEETARILFERKKALAHGDVSPTKEAMDEERIDAIWQLIYAGLDDLLATDDTTLHRAALPQVLAAIQQIHEGINPIAAIVIVWVDGLAHGQLWAGIGELSPPPDPEECP